MKPSSTFKLAGLLQVEAATYMEKLRVSIDIVGFCPELF